jgi:acyl-CoA reductase-like NAD-dependent aldehyde dehydrogenase
MNTYRQHIGGEWVDASDGGTWDVRNPATEEVVRAVPYGGAADCERAIDAAAAAFPAWAARTPYERGAVLKRAADLIRASLDDLARTTVLESGKPLIQARGEWAVSADLLEWFAEEGKRAYGRIVPSRTAAKRLMVLKQPLGVIGVITAWNFPVYNVARAGAAALAAGCTVVVRPSEYTPMTAMEFVRLLIEGGMPPGVVNLINGAPGPMGQAMLARPDCAKIHFTGSVRVGKLLMDGASKTVTRLSLELGGNAPVLVFPDVDLAQLAAGATAAKFRNGGQVCIAPQRFLVAHEVADVFVERVAAAVGLRVGAGLDPDTQVGPLINAQQRDRVEALVGSARTSGAHVHTGGRRPASRQGLLLRADRRRRRHAVHAALPRGDFRTGPAGHGVRRHRRSDRAGERHALRPRGLRLDQQFTAALRTAERLQFGMVGVNEWTPQSIEAPFVGWKESGLGREAARKASRSTRDQAGRDRGHAVMSEGGAHIERTLGRWDLVLLKVVAIVNINNVPPVAVYGWFSLVLWALAFVCFFIPEAIAVLVLSRRHPGEGGIYLWTRKEFGDAHGFLSGWCYWTNNLFYIPVLLVT